MASITLNSYDKRSTELLEIQDACNRVEQGESVDLNRVSEKLSSLAIELDRDASAIQAGARVTPDIRHAHIRHKNDLTNLQKRVNTLSAQTRSSWVKPAIGLG